jgi:hypothetical protein
MKRYTIAEIKRANQAAGWHFFDRTTMQHCGDTMKRLKVRHTADGNVYVITTSGSIYRFNPDNSTLLYVSPDHVTF